MYVGSHYSTFQLQLKIGFCNLLFLVENVKLQNSK